MQKSDIHNKLARYFSNNCSLEEIREVEAWKNESSENELIFRESSLIWENAKLPETDHIFNTEGVLDKMNHMIDMEISLYQKPQRFYYTKKIAAILVVVIGLFFVVRYLSLTLAPSPMYAETTTSGVTEITLPDDSEVWINKSSQLKYPTKFSKKERKVTLVGEAFFSVKKNPGKPFIIETPKSTIKVLGTQFNVRARDNEEVETITVSEGLVRVNENINNKNSIEIAGGEKAELNKNTGEITKGITQNENFDSWKTGNLEFNNVKFEDVARVLSEYFDKTIVIQDLDLKNTVFNGSFQQYSLNKILNIFRVTNSVYIENKDSVIYLSLKPIE